MPWPWRGRTAAVTPSPNAGVAEAAFAGALGVRLGGRNDYGSHVEDRPVLGGHGRAPRADDIARAARLGRAITAAAAVACAAVALARGEIPDIPNEGG